MASDGKLRGEAGLLSTWLLAGVRHWVLLMTGPILSFLLGLYGAATANNIPRHWYVWIALSGVPVVFYLVWRAEYVKNHGALADGDALRLYRETSEARTRLGRHDAHIRATAPRSITAEQASAIIVRLKPLNDAREAARIAADSRVRGGIQLAVHTVGHDDGYARQLREVLSAANFGLTEWSLGTHHDDDYYYGITVRWSSARSHSLGVAGIGDDLARALRAAGIDAEVRDDPEAIALELIVGARRPAAAVS